MSRRRSSSFTSAGLNAPSMTDDPGDASSSDEIVRRAASLSKIYLAGSAPVDVADESKITGAKKVEIAQPTGALSAKALDALSEGLQLTSLGANMGSSIPTDAHKPSEEELEERKMEEEEEKKLLSEKKPPTTTRQVKEEKEKN